MKPTSTFDDICLQLTSISKEKTIVIGILVADAQQSAAKEYILNYMDRFDMKSGKFIDFYIPGYYSKEYKNEVDILHKYHPLQDINIEEYGEKVEVFKLRRNQTLYYFSRELFTDFIEEMEKRLKIKYTYNPMLILVEVEKRDGNIYFKRKLVIDLCSPNARKHDYYQYSGMLFDLIFDTAKKGGSLEKFGEVTRGYFFKKGIIDDMVKVLDKAPFEAVKNLSSDLLNYRCKPFD